jgi:isoleucyl-tRNA synthetase
MDNPYKTMDLDYMESIWWVFKQLWDKGLIYEGYRSMHICPRCETTLSQSEVAEGYKDIKDLSCIAKFELVDEPGTFVLAWTTTPWTLIGNVALAIGADIDYVLVSRHSREGGNPDNLILAKARVGDVLKNDEFEIVKEFKGSDLIGKSYQPLFDYYANDEKLTNRANGWKIYDADFVTTEEGTGVVHIAPAFGEDDMNLGKAKNLPFVQHVGMDGNFKPEVKDFPGLNVKPLGDHMSTDIEIVKYLASKNLLFDKAKYEHSYPHCWRCDTPLLNYATSSYFVKVEAIKDQALTTAKDINWSPEHIKEGRFGQWLSGARDWSISRQRFWASVLPIWKCACGEQKVVGSVQELKDLSGQEITDLHKHIVDKITFKCSACGGEMKRVPDVLDTWFDSGSMPYAQMHYPFANKEKFEANFPAEFIAEGVDQTRAWFYYLHIIANGIFGKAAFKNVIVNGIVLAEDGKKMSKKLQNYPDPNEVLDYYGADALRAYLLSAPVTQAENLNFSEKGVEEALRKNIMILWNVYKFYETYAGETKTVEAGESKNVLDTWILSKLNQLIKETTESMTAYNLPKAIRPITAFVDDFSTWYLRRSRDRFKDESADKEAALATTKFVFLELSKVMAPFMPFVSETLWQKVSGFDFKDNSRSVHLEAWPTVGNIDEQVLVNMDITKKAVEVALAKRDEAGIKVRQPLPGLLIKNCSLANEYLELIKDEVNVKEATCQFGEGDLLVELDAKISDELAAEGLKRELVRAINALRKKAGLSINDKVEVFVDNADDAFKAMVALYNSEITKETISTKLLVESLPENSLIKEEVKLNNYLINIALRS